MGIRIQPMEVVIPDDKPFKYDLLDRKDKAEVLTSLVSNIDGPCTMAVDAAWGAGKTTFLKMWEQHLRNEGFPVVEFNAWETDASGDPFLALTTEITEQLKVWTDSTVASRLHQTQFLAKKLFRRAAPGAIRAASGFIPIFGTEVGHALSSYASEAMAGYFDQKQSAAQFKASLQELANSLRASSGNKPTIVLIDELDRCRPSYAIELLETAKHIFGVDNVVFVLAVNRTELAHSVRVLYGDRFEAEGYLRRFFDIEFRLPAPDREALIGNMLASLGIDEFLANSRDQYARSHMPMVSQTLILFLSRSDLSLRSIGQAIHRFGVVLSSLGNSPQIYVRTLTVLTLLSAFDYSLYRRFVEHDVTDEETIRSVFHHANLEGLRLTPSGLLVEAVIIAANIGQYDFRGVIADLEERSPRFFQIRGLYERQTRSSDIEEVDQRIFDIMSTLMNFHRRGTESLGLEESVQRFELLTANLVKPNAGPASMER